MSGLGVRSERLNPHLLFAIHPEEETDEAEPAYWELVFAPSPAAQVQDGGPGKGSGPLETRWQSI